MKVWIEKNGRTVGWYDTEGERKQKTLPDKTTAKRYKAKIAGELATGTYQVVKPISWEDFIERWKKDVGRTLGASTLEMYGYSIANFTRVARPKDVKAITTSLVDRFISARSKERGRKPDELVSPATVNRELRELKRVISFAVDWKYLTAMPKFRMRKEPEKLTTFVTPEHFELIYQHCDAATLPDHTSIKPSDYWRALVTFLYLTGWRVSEPQAIQRDDLDLSTCEVITWHDDNKGKRSERVQLHPIVVDHLKQIQSFEDSVFPWVYGRRSILDHFHKIQRAAGIHLRCRGKHKHTPACHVYGFHDLRRAFATENAIDMSPIQLQKLMRHKCFSTTQRYINAANKHHEAVAKIKVPDVLKNAAGKALDKLSVGSV